MDNPILSVPYWISLDSLVDVERLVGMHEQLSYGFAKGVRSAAGYGSFHSKGDYLSGKMQEFFALPADHPMKVRCANLDGYQKSLYIGLLNHGLSVSETLNITGQKSASVDLGMKHDPQSFTANKRNYPLFACFIDWLEDQQIFDSYGRVYGFLNCPFQDAPAHVDMEEPDKPCEFIWLRTEPKPFYVCKDKFSTEDERYYVDGNVIWFNPGMFHGAAKTECYAFSIRVDGVFTREFRSKIYNLGDNL